MSDCLVGLDPEYCPSLDDCHDELRALLPRGKAWEGAHQPNGVQWGFWRAVAYPIQFAHQRICDLRRQFWCQTADELRDAWLVEYGLPDACDPFPDLCAKVSALGGTTCDYYEGIAFRAGWRVVCSGDAGDCGGYLDLMQMDCSVLGGDLNRSRLVFMVYLADSPAYTQYGAGPIISDYSVYDAVFDCDPDIDALRCLLDRVVPAHVETLYTPIF